MIDQAPAAAPDGLSKSEKIRQMAGRGLSKSDIARHLGVRYQFVYNVLKAAAPARQQDPVPAHDNTPGGHLTADQEGLTIGEAKRRLALTFGVDPSAITITVQG